jgi:hypothetical protein
LITHELPCFENTPGGSAKDVFLPVNSICQPVRNKVNPMNADIRRGSIPNPGESTATLTHLNGLIYPNVPSMPDMREME